MLCVDLGLEVDNVALKKHNTNWIRYFNREKQFIQNKVDYFKTKKCEYGINKIKDDVHIKHIGSTSIEGVLAKPIIDILVGYGEKENVHDVIALLIGCGYKYLGECGRQGRIFMVKSCKDKVLYHLHLVAYKEYYWNNFTKFKEILKHNNEVKNEYNEIKINLKNKGLNREEYRRLKGEFVEKIMERECQYDR